MSSKINSRLLEKALTLLAGRLELDGAPPINMIVCGGAALIALDLVSRPTNDVDMVALIDESGRLKSSEPLPAQLSKAARHVADDLGLPENWLNSGPTGLITLGLPAGFRERLRGREYGSGLTVNFISRLDQIHFKLYAAVDQGPGYHVDDLFALNPSPEELEAAAAWALTHDNSEAFKSVLKDMLKKFGYETISKRL